MNNDRVEGNWKQVKGKVKARLEVSPDISEADLEALASSRVVPELRCPITGLPIAR